MERQPDREARRGPGFARLFAPPVRLVVANPGEFVLRSLGGRLPLGAFLPYRDHPGRSATLKGFGPLAADRMMRLHAQTATIENGFVHLPDEAPWLAGAVSELTMLPAGPPRRPGGFGPHKALAWAKQRPSFDEWIETRQRLRAREHNCTLV
jgi:hypothetical protein